MTSIYINNSDEQFSVCLIGASDTSLRYEPDENVFRLSFHGGGHTVSASISPELLQTLVLKSIVRLPELETPHRVTGDAEAIRQPARFIHRYDDRTLQAILREVDMPILTAFLWFMKDELLLKRVLGNMSRRLAEFQMEYLSDTWSGINPDQPLRASQFEEGENAVAEILALCRKMTKEGLIPEVSPRPEKLPGEDGKLTAEEIDALLEPRVCSDEKDKP